MKALKHTKAFSMVQDVHEEDDDEEGQVDYIDNDPYIVDP
jgi:hypothetical protein